MNKECPWLDYDGYGEDPPDSMIPYDPEEYPRYRRNQQMIRQGDGYYRNEHGRAEKVRNPPRVVGRRWGQLLEKYGEES